MVVHHSLECREEALREVGHCFLEVYIANCPKMWCWTKLEVFWDCPDHESLASKTCLYSSSWSNGEFRREIRPTSTTAAEVVNCRTHGFSWQLVQNAMRHTSSWLYFLRLHWASIFKTLQSSGLMKWVAVDYSAIYMIDSDHRSMELCAEDDRVAMAGIKLFLSHYQQLQSLH